MILKNKVVVITGASEGIGKQIALKLAGEKCKLALVARNENNLKKVSEECKKLGSPKVLFYVQDITKTGELKSLVSRIISDFGCVDILVNNAGVWQKLGQVDDLSAEDVDNVISINLSSLIHLTRLFLPTLRKLGEAIILNVCSKSGVVAQAGQSVYTASKFGVKGFTDVLKADLEGSGIRVGGVYQSGTNTRMFEKAGDVKVPVEKFTNPKDLAEVVRFMLSRPEKIWVHEVHVEF